MLAFFSKKKATVPKKTIYKRVGAMRFFEVLKELYDKKKPADGGSIV